MLARVRIRHFYRRAALPTKAIAEWHFCITFRALEF